MKSASNSIRSSDTYEHQCERTIYDTLNSLINTIKDNILEKQVLVPKNPGMCVWFFNEVPR